MALSTSANLTWGRMTRAAEPYTTTRYKVKNGVTVYPWTLVELSGGYVQALQTAAAVALGIMLPTTASNPNSPVAGSGITGDTSASPVPEADIFTGRVWLEQVAVTGAAAITDVGSLVYGDVVNAQADHVLTLTSLNNSAAVGRVTRWYSGTTCDVELFGSASLRT